MKDRLPSPNTVAQCLGEIREREKIVKIWEKHGSKDNIAGQCVANGAKWQLPKLYEKLSILQIAEEYYEWEHRNEFGYSYDFRHAYGPAYLTFYVDESHEFLLEHEFVKRIKETFLKIEPDVVTFKIKPLHEPKRKPMDIQKDIQDAIEKQLPAQVGEVLRQRLEQAEKDAATVKQNATTIAEFRSDVRKLEAQVESRDARLKQHAEIDKREAEVSQRERDLKITLLEAQLVTEREKAQFAKDVALGLVRNIEFRRAVFENSNKQVPTAPGSYTQSQNETNSTTTTETTA